MGVSLCQEERIRKEAKKAKKSRRVVEEEWVTGSWEQFSKCHKHIYIYTHTLRLTSHVSDCHRRRLFSCRTC